MYFLKKGVRSVQWGTGQSLRTYKMGNNFREFCVKSILTVCNLLLTVSYGEKNWGSGMY